MTNKKIGVQNFRIFKNYTEFELRPLTLLTGPNNSGKSSLTKLLLLLQHDLNFLNFDQEAPALESFDSILPWGSSDGTLKIELNNTIPVLNENYFTEFQFRHAQVSDLSISSSEGQLLRFSFDPHATKDLFKRGRLYINFDIQAFIELIYSKEILVEGFRFIEDEDNDVLTENLAPLKDVKFQSSLIVPQDLDIRNLYIKTFDQFKKYHGDAYLMAKEWRNRVLIDEINSLDKNYILFDFIDQDGIPQTFPNDLILEYQKEAFFNIELDIPRISKSNSFSDFCEYARKKCIIHVKERLLSKLSEEFKFSGIARETKLGNLLFHHTLFSDDFNAIKDLEFIGDNLFERLYFKETLFEQLFRISFDLQDYIGRFEYISPHRAHQKRVLANHSEYEIDQIIVQYSRLVFNQKEDFLQKILNIFEIEGDLKIERFENEISVIYLERRNRKISLADLGYGYSQLIPIFLKIIILAGEDSQCTLILEEPEANLHPDLQSKLADALVLCLLVFPNLNFIIETHSEYLIRKLQYLTAKKELNQDQSVIYYFNSDKYVSREERKVKKIEITSTGNLTDTFGPGFYDEATKLKFDLMKINKEQNN